jgi:ElaB/YqjD/DUF883 family membrane-anchored ribosome-binding protein
MTTQSNTGRSASSADSKSAPHAASQAIPQEWMTDIARQAESLDRSVREFLNERPLALVLGAVGIGIVAGLIMKRRAA